MNTNDYSNLAHEILSEYNSADDPGLLRQKIAEAFADVVQQAIADERERCAKIVDTKSSDYSGDTAHALRAIAGRIRRDSTGEEGSWRCRN